MEVYSKVQAEYAGLQNRTYRPPMIMVYVAIDCHDIPDAKSMVRFVPSLHQLPDSDFAKIKVDLLAHPEAKLVCSEIIRQYGENPGKIIDVCAKTRLPMFDLESYVVAMMLNNMIFPGMTENDCFTNRMEALRCPTSLS